MKPSLYPTQPEHIWSHFYEITRIPRPSGQEAAMRDYIIGLADERQLKTQVDNAGNLVVYVPASEGFEAAPVVAIQNHMDMVTVKTAETEHDFKTDPLQLTVNDGWLKATGTTLGADNGIGVAAALAVMTDPSVIHPPLELLFTTEEETGLYGASGLDASLLSATRLLNLDTEDWGEIYIGCAGGYGYEASRELMPKLPTPGLKPYLLHLKGLSGGHSGVQIHEQLGNANKLLVELLTEASDLTWQMVSFRGGVAHNVIAREASAVIMIDDTQIGLWEDRLSQAKARWNSYLPEVDKDLHWVFEPAPLDEAMVLSEADQSMFLSLIAILPHGAQSYNLNQPADLVDLSCNLAKVTIDHGVLTVQTSLRFFNAKQSLGLKQTIEQVFETFHLAWKNILDYPGWNPNFDSALVALTKEVMEKQTGYTAELKAIHAGLECGILLSKKADMDVVSMGPTIRGAHSPSERLQIDTVEPFWQTLVTLLSELTRR
ncbi:beta-Ala-His dipeptidase [Reinekea blandensis]|uniref:Cytosol non-specific dipeptidase n=1 Tax=Reinekea blandensis MED297 TaxID=314283 RepID=A4BET2_9GAMM|nr:beta-Ala-His dipeptidase [Reinekea blandensis]EAR09267.1 aminoacyl-histidine dipeptidase precursor [Reinekea sp. MED297] [Reinekea blandensis MED297]